GHLLMFELVKLLKIALCSYVDSPDKRSGYEFLDDLHFISATDALDDALGKDHRCIYLVLPESPAHASGAILKISPRHLNAVLLKIPILHPQMPGKIKMFGDAAYPYSFHDSCFFLR